MPKYQPIGNAPPEDLAELARYLTDELRRIAAVFNAMEVPGIVWEELHAPPEKLFEGLVAFADGTDWDPGSGIGLYQRRSAAWVLIG